MSPRIPAASGFVIVVLGAVLVTACGEDVERQAQARPSGAPPAAIVERDPYAIACGHVREQIEYSGLTRRATVAIADRERIRGLNRLQVTQSLFYAMTEICKGKPETFRPARASVKAVRDGTYRADLSKP